MYKVRVDLLDTCSPITSFQHPAPTGELRGCKQHSRHLCCWRDIKNLQLISVPQRFKSLIQKNKKLQQIQSQIVLTCGSVFCQEPLPNNVQICHNIWMLIKSSLPKLIGIFLLYHSDSTENKNSQSIKNNFLYYFLDIDLLRVEEEYTRPLRKVILFKEHEDNKKNSFNNCWELRRRQACTFQD